MFELFAFALLPLVAGFNSSCPCWFGMWLSRNGLGNRVAETASGLAMADELGCQYLFDREGFVRDSVHGSYDEALRFLNIDAGLPTYDDIKSQVKAEVKLHEWPWRAQEAQCGTLFVALHTQICRLKDNYYTTWCTKMTDYNLVKQRFREQFYRVPQALALRPGRALSVAWHLRVGDIAPDRGNHEFYTGVFGELSQLTAQHGVPMNVHIVFNSDAARDEDVRLPPDDAFMDRIVCRHGATCVLHGRETAVESLRLMMSTDVLVTSRSSFPYVAALYSQNIVLFETPKENCDVCYYTSESFRVDIRGRIFALAEFRARMAMLFRSARFAAPSQLA
jgi:hypothetical protein